MLIATLKLANPASSFPESVSPKSAATWGRSCTDSARSSPAIATSSSAFRIPSFDENNRYTVATGTSERSLMASMVVGW